MQQVVITGRVGKDPEMKYFESGKVKTTFSVATSGWNSQTKEKTTNWFNIECWDKVAEMAGEYIKKGKNATVEGFLKEDKYTNQEGQEKTRCYINASVVKFDGSFIVLSGIIERHETRYTSSNKKIQYIKLKDSDIRITYMNEEELKQGDSVVCFCELSMVDNKPNAKALKIDSNSSKKDVVEFAEEDFSDDLIGEEEIPF